MSNASNPPAPQYGVLCANRLARPRRNCALPECDEGKVAKAKTGAISALADSCIKHGAISALVKRIADDHESDPRMTCPGMQEVSTIQLPGLAE